MKWRLASSVLCDKNVPTRHKFYEVIRTSYDAWCKVLTDQELTCPKDKSSGNEDVDMDAWAYQKSKDKGMKIFRTKWELSPCRTR